MSDTPETDNALRGVWYRGDHGSAIPDLCRKLERERNALRETKRELLGALESIANYPVARGYPDGPCIDAEDMKEIRAAIAKAKEAQP